MFNTRICMIWTLSTKFKKIPNCNACVHYLPSSLYPYDNKCQKFPGQLHFNNDGRDQSQLIDCKMSRQNEELCGLDGKEFVNDITNKKNKEYKTISIYFLATGSAFFVNLAYKEILPFVFLFFCYSFSTIWDSVIHIRRLNQIPHDIMIDSNVSNEEIKKTI